MINPESAFQLCIDELNCHGRCFQLSWRVPPELPYLAGHFPGNPILPAVAILDASIFAVEQRVGALELMEVVSAKFLRPVQPGLQLDIEGHEEPLQTWSIQWRLASDKARVADLLLKFDEGPSSETGRH